MERVKKHKLRHSIIKLSSIVTTHTLQRRRIMQAGVQFKCRGHFIVYVAAPHGTRVIRPTQKKLVSYFLKYSVLNVLPYVCIYLLNHMASKMQIEQTFFFVKTVFGSACAHLD